MDINVYFECSCIGMCVIRVEGKDVRLWERVVNSCLCQSPFPVFCVKMEREESIKLGIHSLSLSHLLREVVSDTLPSQQLLIQEYNEANMSVNAFLLIILRNPNSCKSFEI